MIKSYFVQDEGEKLVIEGGENCAMLNARVLMVRFLTHPEQIIYYETKKCRKRFIYISVEEHYFISLQQEREVT